MSSNEDNPAKSPDEAFAKRARELFLESADGIDGEARSRLNQGRQAALAELKPKAGFGRWSQWVPAAGVTAAAAVVVVMWNGQPQVDIDAPVTASDFEILMDEENFDMLQDLEFYSWVEAELEIEEQAGSNVS